jgi:chromate reductase, NAD(P)H dehydrogenase (quinone)
MNHRWLSITSSTAGLSRYLSSSPSTSTSTSVEALNIALLTGTTRTSPGPPDPIDGHRVASYIKQLLEDGWGHNVTQIDPTDFPLLEKPEFCYPRSQVPAFLTKYKSILLDADAIICITPEYNHAPSPGLVNILNHFGSSVVSFKPAGIVSYSAGQWGGTRAAIGLRPILSEMGCLPVSAMIHIPYCQDVLNEDGTVKTTNADTNVKTDKNDDDHDDHDDPKSRWDAYCGRCFSQVEWWATAAKEHKKVVDPFKKSKPFQGSPSQRNAPRP